ncbi:MAG: hypothetical protein KatS3mg012_0076 [Gaiellaceae bacterium]|nr:MAG: hypothetical protein KatS3mg012_0076 [Gaiellaceae bacterium]
MSGGQYVAAAYGVFLVFLLVYVAIIAAKLARLQREAEELRAGRVDGYPRVVPRGSGSVEESE